MRARGHKLNKTQPLPEEDTASRKGEERTSALHTLSFVISLVQIFKRESAEKEGYGISVIDAMQCHTSFQKDYVMAGVTTQE